MKHFFKIIVLLIILARSLNAGIDYNIKTSGDGLGLVEIGGGAYQLKVILQIKNSSGILDLGAFNLRVSYNAVDVIPNLVQSTALDPLLSFNPGLGNAYSFSPIGIPESGVVTVNADFNYTVDLAAYDLPSSSYTDVALLVFNIIHPTGSADLAWVIGVNDNYVTDFEGTAQANNSFNGGYNSPLPVELIAFEANPSEEGIALNWQTATEINNYGFEIERTVVNEEEKEWTKIDFVEGHGNSNSPKDYSFVDKYPTGGIKFAYRLKQVDIDGGYEYSDEVEVDFTPKELVVQQNFPNPFNPTTSIRFSLPKASKVSLEVFNILGESVAVLVDDVKEAGYHQVRFNASRLASGYYIYRLVSNGEVFVKKMLLLK
ncbi:MAG: T9SS type A sorting domain-containing protein [Melioribacteraceae bacterium]|nr:T9SS type A sorting domain-containing protein [Melioribacteraceae bacterium]